MKKPLDDNASPMKEYLGDRVAAHLKARLLAGDYPRGLPGERPLAESLKVSRRVVREAMNTLIAEGVLEPPRERAVRRASESLRREVGAPRGGRIGLVTRFPNPEADPVARAMYEGLRALCAGSGWECLAITCNEARKNAARATAMNLIRRYDCDLWVGYSLPGPQVFDALHEAGRPVLGCNFMAEKPYGVVSQDYDAAVLHAVNTMLRRGRTRVIAPRSSPPRDALVEGMRRIFASRGLPYEAGFNLPEYDGSKAGFIAMMNRLLTGPTPPDGVVISRKASTGWGTLQGVLQAHRLRCPEDVSALAIHGITDHETLTPVPGQYVEGKGRLNRMMMRLVRDYIRTGLVPTTRQTVHMDYLPGESV